MSKIKQYAEDLYQDFVDECMDSGDRGHIISFEEWLEVARQITSQITMTLDRRNMSERS